MTGSELAKILKMSLRDFNHNMNPGLRRTKVAEISASDWFTDSEGNSDRTYTLVSKPKRVIPTGRPINYSKKHFSGDDQRQKNILAAQRRARLMDAGLWPFTEI